MIEPVARPIDPALAEAMVWTVWFASVVLAFMLGAATMAVLGDDFNNPSDRDR